MTKDELTIQECNEITFKNLVIFQKEIANPMLMKKEMNILINRLKKESYRHTNKVITKVLSKNQERKTINLQVMVPLIDTKDITDFLKTNKQYSYIKKFELGKSIKISISNDIDEFKKAVQYFAEYSRVSNINEFHLENNPVIEIAKIDYTGNVVAFDLHMEKVQKETSHLYNS